jgi:hypothetical protein
MRNNDDLLLEQLYQEGIWDRLKGQGAGIKQGAGTLMKNIGGKLTGDTADRPSARTEYAKAQQGSLLKSFVQKVQQEIADFKNDLKLFKVDPNPDTLQKDFPIIAQRLKEIENLEKFLTNPTQTSTTTPEVKTTSQPEPTSEPTPETSKPTTNVQGYLDIKGAADYLKISETELQNKAATGKIKSTIVSGKPLFRKEDLDNSNKTPEPTQQKTEEVPQQKTQEQPKKPKGEITPVRGTSKTAIESPKKNDTVEHGIFKYVYDGKNWVVLSSKKGKTKKAEIIKNPNLIETLNQKWSKQKNAPVKTTKKPSGVTRTETKVGPTKTRYSYKNESYNPFNEFLKECNLL